MKKTLFVTIFICLLFLFLDVKPLPAKKLLSLPELAHPFRIIVYSDQLFVFDRTPSLHLYSLKDFRYVKEISRKGSGPSEIDGRPFLTISRDSLFVSVTNRKGMFFSRNGDYLSEFKITALDEVAQVGKNFFGLKMKNTKKNTTIYEYSIFACEKWKMIPKKPVYSFESAPDKWTGNKLDFNVFNEQKFAAVFEDKIFIADATRGLFVDIFDSSGESVGHVNLSFEKSKVTNRFKYDLIESAKKEPNWETVNSMINIIFPEYFPAFYRFCVDTDRIYFLTYAEKNNRREVIISDWKGKLLKKSDVPLIPFDTLTHFAINKNKFYYIKENEDTDEWELHVEDIK